MKQYHNWKRVMLAWLLLFIVIALLPFNAFSQPHPEPVDVDVSSSTPQWGQGLSYTVYVKATRNVYVSVKVAVRVPGQGWGNWTELWKGYLSAGESKALNGYETRTPTEVGDYVISVEVFYYSSNDYMIIGGEEYFASYDTVFVRKFANDMYNTLKQNYTQLLTKYQDMETSYEKLKSDYNSLQESFSQLKVRCNDLNSSYQSLKSDYNKLQSDYSYLRENNIRLEGSLETTRVIATALGVALAVATLLAMIGWKKAFSSRSH
jgi:archaellum component FlaC